MPGVLYPYFYLPAELPLAPTAIDAVYADGVGIFVGPPLNLVLWKMSLP